MHPIERTPDYSLESYEAEDELGGQTFPTQLETDSRGQKKSPQQTKGFAAATAEVTGESKRTINLNLARAEAIGPATAQHRAVFDV